MTSRCRSFCVLTTGRSGSTSLMQALAAHGDIMLPSKQIDCGDEELLRPDGIMVHRQAYEALIGEQIDGEDALIEAYYRFNIRAPYVGFKSMPHRHARYEAFIRRQDIHFITLVREDIPSTVASFMLAMQRGTWRRNGQEPAEGWAFREQDGPRVRALVLRVLDNQRALSSVPSAIRLSYEQLCAPDFSNPKLEQFFGRTIRIAEPMPPVSAASYTDNWKPFLAVVKDAAKGLSLNF